MPLTQMWTNKELDSQFFNSISIDRLHTVLFALKIVNAKARPTTFC